MALPLRADINPDIVISQVSTDFIEIFNRGGHSVSIAGWSVQYTFGTQDPLWNAISVNGSLAPGQYYLIEVDGYSSLQPDAFGYFPLRFAYGGLGLNFTGTIALLRSPTPLTLFWPTVLDVTDLFGYGQGSVADGTPFPGQPTNSFTFGPQAAMRLEGGCLENHNNATDFQLSSPAPRNSRSPLAPCPTAPSIRANGIVNSASFAMGPVVPGELVTIFGTNLGPSGGAGAQLTPGGTHVTTNLAGAQVLFDGVPAPMIYASTGQVNAVAPFALSGKHQTTIQVEYNGALSASQTLPVSQSAPGIFTSLGTGIGQAAALNQDSTLNSLDLPDPQGSVVVIYATGAGQTFPAGEDGAITGGSPPKPALPVTVTIGGQSANAIYAGNAPGLVSGVLQVNARIPQGLTGRQPVILNVGGIESQSEVTVAVELGVPVPSGSVSIDIGATDIAYDAGTHRLYASIGDDGSSHANSVAEIDPSTGSILGWIQTATGPNILALSDDGHYLYVALHRPHLSLFDAIQRVDLWSGNPDFTVDLKEVYADFSLATDQIALGVGDIRVLPGQPRSLAIAAYETGAPIPVAIIDDDVRRPAIGPPAQYLAAESPGLLLGDQRAYFVTAEGVGAGPAYPLNVDTRTDSITPAGNLLISSTGLVMNGAGNDLLAEFAAAAYSQRGFVYRPDTGLAYYAGNTGLASFDLKTYMVAGLLEFGSLVGDGVPLRLISVGPAGLATNLDGLSRILIFPLSSIQPLEPVAVPSSSVASTGVRRFIVPSNSMAVNSAGDHLYLSVPSIAPPIGNSILPFDVRAGQFGTPVWVGSEPDVAAVSTDGQHLHVMLDGSRNIVRLSLPALAVEKQFHVTEGNGTFLDANVILSVPSSATSVIVGRTEFASTLFHTYGMAIYDDGIPRPDTTTTYNARTGAAGPLVNEAQLSADGSALYGEQGEFEGAQLSRWTITPNGFQFDAAGTLFGEQLYLDLNCQRTLCLTGSGYLADTNTLQLVTQLAQYADDGLALMDLDNNRMFLLSYSGADTRIESYDATTYKLTGRYVISLSGSAHSFKKLAGDQLAIATGGELILLPISVLQPQ